MLSTDDISQLRRLIEEEAQKSPTILGARIGDIVKKQFPDASIKREFGSLGRFISTHFADLIFFHDKSGNDNEYTLKLQNPAIIADSPNLASAPASTSDKKSGDAAASGFAMAQRHVAYKTEQLPFSADVMLRQAIKNAVDLMTPEQLRQLVLPAGILFDAISKATRT